MHFGNIGTKTKALLTALKITDPDNTLSLTSISVMVLIGKIAWAPTIDWPTTATLLLSLLSYNFKKTLILKEKETAAEADSKISEIERKVQEINQAMAVKSMLGR